MKTPAEWLKEIKHLSDTEVRHGSSVFLLESDIENILVDGWRRGMSEAADIANNWTYADDAEEEIRKHL